jgi:superoxide dismutase, Fe-Mn family
MSETTRREFVQVSTAALLAANVASGAVASTEPTAGTSAREFSETRTPVPLPFNPKSLKGLSDKLIQSHWQNNYGGAVKALNTVRGRLNKALSDAETPAYLYAGLKREPSTGSPPSSSTTGGQGFAWPPARLAAVAEDPKRCPL